MLHKNMIAIYCCAFLYLAIYLSNGGAACAQSGKDVCLSDAACIAAVERAKSLSSQSEYETAIEKYKEVYQKWPAPWIIFNIGRVYHKMSQFSSAAIYYQRYVEDDQVTDLAQQEQARILLSEVRLKIEPRPQDSAVQAAVQQPIQPATSLPRKQPLYKKWWIWTLAGLAVGGIVTGAVVGTQIQPSLSSDVPRYSPF